MRALAPHWAALAVRAAGGRWAPPVPPRRGRSGPGPPGPREWALPVSPRGRLRVRLPCQVTVRPLDPQRWPGADRVLVAVSGGSPAPRGRERQREPVRVEHDEALGQVAIVADDVDSKAAVDVRTPVKFDLDIKTSGTGCVKIQKIECDNCRIETEKGTSVLQSIKSHKIDIRTNGGKVIGLGTLYGNTDICATEKGSVNIEKLQGTTINISTEDGLLKTKYLYAESSSLSSVTGDIMLGSVHGNTTLETKTGSITVDSSDGSLKASTYHGTIDVYVSQLRKVDLKSQKGSITVKVPASLKAYLELSGRKVDVNSEIQLKETQRASKDDHVTISGHMNQKDETDKWIKAETQNGKVYLKSQSWIQSVKLKSS
ncbi:protein FAM185A [Myiozetetes cayanensis]|uniref:protein FAM185A n=1 Tax=Myiozetetes cayanensis TaxID=478635 RepID=UPI00215F8EC3|nr:protein FAM185A [Myiozetetes cayanensis]